MNVLPRSLDGVNGGSDGDSEPISGIPTTLNMMRPRGVGGRGPGTTFAAKDSA